MAATESIIVPATLDSLEKVSDYLTEVGSKANLDSKAIYRLRLAVDELITNVILHAYAANSGTLRLESSIDSTTLTICLEDSGPAFDPRSAEPPDLSLPVEDRPVGGLGIHFVLQSVDNFRYERRGNLNRNIIVMRRSA